MSKLLLPWHPGTVLARGWGSTAWKLSRSLFGWPRWGNKEARERKRAERGQGYMGDVQDFRNFGGKKFKARNELVPKPKAVKFPAFTAEAVAGGSVSMPLQHPALVLMSFRNFGQKMCNKYRRHFEEAELESRVTVVELVCLDKWSFKISRRWIESTLRRTVPANIQKHLLLVYGDVVGTLRADLDIHNSLVGYVYLVDGKGRVRWRAHADPTKSELEAMVKCTHDLLDRGYSIPEEEIIRKKNIESIFM